MASQRLSIFIPVTAAQAAINNWVSQGYLESSAEAYWAAVPSYYGTEYYYGVFLKGQTLQRLSEPNNAVLHIGACSGGVAYGDWTANGSGSMASYGSACSQATIVDDARIFWQAMNGYSGRAVRNLGNATFNTNLVLNSGANTALVLAPWMLDMLPPAGTVITKPATGYITFDTLMGASGLSSGVTVADALGFWSAPTWASSTRIDFTVYPKSLGTGRLIANGASLVSTGGVEVCTNGVQGSIELRIYQCIPATNAVALTHMTAEPHAAGAAIRWATAWESGADSFRVERIDDPVNPTWVGAIHAVGNGGPAAYEMNDPSGQSGSRYRIVERQTGQLPDLRYGVIEADTATAALPWESPSYDTDSLAAAIDALGNPGETIEGGGIPGRYVLIAPDSLCAALGAYKGTWEEFGGESPDIVPISETFLQGGIKGYLAWAHFYHTDYALLVGDANDADWWDDPSKWTNGWQWPRVAGTETHIPSQPERNLIPTFYVADNDSPSVAMSFYTPYYAADLPYADVDNDGLADLRLGRLPVASTSEIQAYTAKLRAYLSTTPPARRAVLLTYAQNNGAVRGDDVAADASDVAASMPAGINVTHYLDSEASLWTYAYRESVATSAVNSAPTHVFWMASGAQRDIYANYWRLDKGWSMSDLEPVASPDRTFVSMSMSCGMGNFDQTEDYTSCTSSGCTGPITPIAERLLLDAQKGAIAIVGPSRGTFEAGNRMLAVELSKQLLGSTRDLGTAFMIAQRNCMVRYPDYTDLFRSYNLLGDPMLGGPIVTGVEMSGAQRAMSLGRPRPNPFNPSTVLTVTLQTADKVMLRVFDIHGRLVRTLLRNEQIGAGTRMVKWDGLNDNGSKVASGVYLIRMEASGRVFQERVVLLK